MDKTPDVSQLSTCCGEPLEWAQDDDCYEAHCSCGAVVTRDSPERELTPNEDLLLARIAELEATLANERGEGDPPCEGWEWRPDWQDWRRGRVCVRRDIRRGWQCGEHAYPTARDAMRAASGVPDAVSL